ncbi:MAG: Cytidine/deoxycytidylate deaminase family protein [candidate division TA06 bacterium 32_111]|uniref:Cytidine/deoxycytidylate deaminase family protein n=2 Tax=Bacteria candidate phyla TaxID=1783234 RepID=A0A101I3G3_UNCT6|nr:MAG: Cytidine/deoxycytidylate deaminase family protein [candidate division TA06 bacterium 32_111]KUK88251.1 MAG: Cytidine/deoxycytidylate deaminase family protein [candidate division TA06 bacterium 34_109]HAF07184.1 cytidine deaminase [candidate division WOR-3 bacterium]HCP16035.1 cytidine deaminase [candidate division WOR-3 bacterium]
MDRRPSWDEYFMEITKLVATRATCLRRKVGAIIVKDRHILSTGYNGPPKGVKHCDELGGCLREKLNIPSGERMELSRAVHAEQNAIIQAAKLGINIEGADMYVTNQPCFICAKMIINAGVKRVIINEGYPDKYAEEILKEANVKLIVFNKKKEDE